MKTKQKAKWDSHTAGNHNARTQIDLIMQQGTIKPC